MKKNYRKGIMKIDTVDDEATKYKRECIEEISLLPYFESDGENADNISSVENDGVENSQNDK